MSNRAMDIESEKDQSRVLEMNEGVPDREFLSAEQGSHVISSDWMDLTVVKDPLGTLEPATTVSEIKAIRDKAEAVRRYAQNAHLGLSVQNMAAELKLLAERKAGKALASMSLHGGDRRSKRHRDRLTLADLGITQTQSRRWQMEASVPESTFRRFVDAANSQHVEITASGLLKIARKLKMRADAKGREIPNLRSRSNRHDVVEELLNHSRLFDSLISPLYSSNANESITLKDGERKMLRRLVREFTRLLTSLRRDLEREDRRA